MVEIADEISGPYCGKLFVDLGAEVTKIEASEGDSLRRWGPFPGGEPDPDRAGLFEYLNAGKRGTVLDITSEAARWPPVELIADADVLIDGSAPGTAGKMRTGIEAAELNPGLVVVRISNFGQHGPFRDRGGDTADDAGGVGLDHRTRSRPPAGAGRRPDRRIRRGCLRGAGRADRAADRSRRVR